MTRRFITVTLEDGVGRITLNRPDRHNALTDAVLDEIHAAVQQLEAHESSRVVILSGAGRSFCSGFDVTSRENPQDMTAADWMEHSDRVNRVFESIWRSPLPFIAQVHGNCLGLGCELAAVCDITVCSSDAVIGEPEVRFGAGPLFNVLPLTVGRKASMYMLLSGENITPDEALIMGFVTKVVDPQELASTSAHIARKIALSPKLSVQVFKRSVRAVYEAGGFLTTAEATGAAFTSAYLDSLPMRLEFARTAREKGFKFAYQELEDKQAAAVLTGPVDL